MSTPAAALVSLYQVVQGEPILLTIINKVPDKGYHGFHEAICCLTTPSNQVIVLTAVLEEQVEPILAGLGPLFNKHSGAIFVTDVAVSRREHFVAK